MIHDAIISGSTIHIVESALVSRRIYNSIPLTSRLGGIADVIEGTGVSQWFKEVLWIIILSLVPDIVRVA